MFAADTYAEGASLGLKALDATVSDGSMDAVTSQGVEFGLNFTLGRLLPATKAGVIRHLEAAGRVSRSGVRPSLGIRVTTTATADATAVTIPYLFDN